MMPARLEKYKQTVPQLAHTVPLSELEKGAPTGPTQAHGLMVWQIEWRPYLAPLTLLGAPLYNLYDLYNTASTANTYLLSSSPIIRLWNLHQDV